MGLPPVTYIVIIPEEHISKYEVPEDACYKTVYMTEKEFLIISQKVIIQKHRKSKKKNHTYSTFGAFDISILLSLRRDNKINGILST